MSVCACTCVRVCAHARGDARCNSVRTTPCCLQPVSLHLHAAIAILHSTLLHTVDCARHIQSLSLPVEALTMPLLTVAQVSVASTVT